MNTRLQRRDFLKLAATGGGALVLAVYLDGCAPGPVTPTGLPTVMPSAVPTEEILPSFAPNLFLKIDTRGRLTVIAFRSELGQGIRTAIAMILADELDMDWDSVRIEQADADSRYGNQITGGSVSVSGNYRQLRQAAASARAMLVQAAADQWKVDPAGCKTADGNVIHPDGSTRLAYGELVEAASVLDVPDVSSIKLKEPEEFKIIGTDKGHWDGPQIVSGKAVFGMDVRLPGMLFAVMARCPVIGGKLVSMDESAALKVPGVQQVIQVDGKPAVIATNTWAALQGRQALVLTWDEGKKASLQNEALFETLKAKLPAPGSVKAGGLEAYYEIPYEAHQTMEPMNATADVRADSADIWVPTQDAQQIKALAAGRLKLAYEAVAVHVTLAGGGFGRRHLPDAALEAAMVSQAVGAPVQLVWTREDDTQHDYYHPMSVQYASMSDLTRALRPTPIITSDPGSLPTHYWRSVENFPDAFGRECFLDEMAAAMKLDPLDLRRELFSGEELEVIELAAEKAGWGTPLPEGKGRGLAFYSTFGVTDVADVVDVAVDAAGHVRVERVVCAVNCGRAINPDNVKAQMEGGIVFGITAALKGGVTIQNGRVVQSNFRDAPILQMDEMPLIEVYIVPSDKNPTGVGEMGVPPIVPAVCNAVFAATGKRFRRLPLLKNGVLV